MNTIILKQESDLKIVQYNLERIENLKGIRNEELLYLGKTIHLCYQLTEKKLEIELKKLLNERIKHWNIQINKIENNLLSK